MNDVPINMKTPTIDKELIFFITLLDEKQKEAVLALIKSFIKPQRQTIDEYNRELEEANERIENGEFITAEQLKKDAQNW